MKTPVEELRYLVLALQREGNRQFSEALRSIDLTPAQAEVLRVLDQFGPITLLELGERLVCESGSPSRLVKGMVEAGLLEKTRSQDDGRAVILTITKEGKRRLPGLTAIEDAIHQELERHLGSLPILPDVVAVMRQLLEDTEAGRAVQLRREHAAKVLES